MTMTMYFKDEDGPEADPIGPVSVVDHDALNAWRVAQGLDPDSVGIPYGSTPEGIENLGWHPLSWARAEADRRGVELVTS